MVLHWEELKINMSKQALTEKKSKPQLPEEMIDLPKKMDGGKLYKIGLHVLLSVEVELKLNIENAIHQPPIKDYLV